MQENIKFKSVGDDFGLATLPVIIQKLTGKEIEILEKQKHTLVFSPPFNVYRLPAAFECLVQNISKILGIVTTQIIDPKPAPKPKNDVIKFESIGGQSFQKLIQKHKIVDPTTKLNHYWDMPIINTPPDENELVDLKSLSDSWKVYKDYIHNQSVPNP